MAINPMAIESRRMLSNVQEEHAFRLKDGASIRNLKELYSALKGMERDVFRHHCNEDKNDFGNWVKDVHKDYKLANSLFMSKTKEDFMKAVGSRIYELEKVVAPPQRSIVVKQASTPATVAKPASEKVEVKRKTPPAAKARPAAKVKSDVEIAKERLEQILIDSVKQKMDRIALEKARKEKKKEKSEPVELEQELQKTTASDILSEISVQEQPSRKVDDPVEEMLEFTEVKSFSKQLKDEISTVFKRSSMKEFKSDMKKLFATGESGKDEEYPDHAPTMDVSSVSPPEKVEADDIGKDDILSHLKRVFK